jgi:hypothetical protein
MYDLPLSRNRIAGSIVDDLGMDVEWLILAGYRLPPKGATRPGAVLRRVEQTMTALEGATVAECVHFQGGSST